MPELFAANTWSSAGDQNTVDSAGPIDVPFERFDQEWTEQPVAARFEQMVRRYGERIAIDDGTRSMTYGAVWQLVRRLVRRIEEQVPPQRPLGILSSHNALFPAAALACLASGRPYVPVATNLPAARMQELFGDAGLAALIVDSEVPIPLMSELPAIAVLASGDDDSAASEVRIDSSIDAPAVILYTSGSTGKPKGICNSQRAILQRVEEATNSCHVHPEDNFLLLSSTGTIAGEREMLTALLNGATLYMRDPHLAGIHGVLATLREQRITISYMVPVLLRALLRSPAAAEAFAHMRIARVGGDITLESDLALFRSVAPASCRFYASFSSTEVPAVFQWFVPANWQGDSLRLPVGYLRPGMDCMTVGEDGEPVAPGEVGELVVRSRFLALGYWQNGGLQTGPFEQDPDDAGLRILRTGDMVRQRQDGLWELIGRRDRQLKIRGLRTDPTEVEAILREDADVVDAAVIARRQGAEVVALVAYVVPGPRADGGLLARLRNGLAARVPPHMRPAAIRSVPAIPQLPGFKPDMAALERLDRLELDSGAAPAAAESPVSNDAARPATAVSAEVREAVRGAWANILGQRSLENELRWDQTGGDSLKAIQLWFQIEERLGRKLPPLDVLNDGTTPGSLMAAIEQHLAQGAVRGAPAASGAPTIFLMPGVAGDEPLLARFRACCGDSIDFRTLVYPEWRETMDAGAGFAAIVDAVVEQICAEPGHDTYRLAGYSFGGFVAYEAARRLVESGRKVSFLGLLDSRRWDMANAGERYRMLLADPGRIPAVTLRMFLALFVQQQWFAPLGAMAEVGTARPSAFSFTFRQHLNDKLRLGALRRWQLQPLDVPATLFLSDERLRGAPLDYGWGALCKSLKVVHIGGTHASMMEPPLRDRLRQHFLEAL